jgi:hypothetical protein
MPGIPRVARGTTKHLSRVRGVYALVDPRSGITMYVGQAVDVKSPYHAHLACKGTSNPRKAAWVRELKAEGLLPTLVLVQKWRRSKVNEIEIKEIARLRKIGQRSFNFSSGAQRGGQGTKIKKPTVFAKDASNDWDPNTPEMRSIDAVTTDLVLTLRRAFPGPFVNRRRGGRRSPFVKEFSTLKNDAMLPVKDCCGSGFPANPPKAP